MHSILNTPITECYCGMFNIYAAWILYKTVIIHREGTNKLSNYKTSAPCDKLIYIYIIQIASMKSKCKLSFEMIFICDMYMRAGYWPPWYHHLSYPVNRDPWKWAVNQVVLIYL